LEEVDRMLERRYDSAVAGPVSAAAGPAARLASCLPSLGLAADVASLLKAWRLAGCRRTGVLGGCGWQPGGGLGLV